MSWTGTAARHPRWTRWLRLGLTVALLGVAAAVAASHSRYITTALGLLAHTDPYRLLVAIGAELFSMMAFARQQRWLLRAGGVRLGILAMAEIIFAGNALGTTLPGGVAWGATWSFGQLRRRGAERALAVWVLLTAGALSVFTLFAIIVTGVLVAGAHGPLRDLRTLAGALAAVPVLTFLGSWVVARCARCRRTCLRSWRALETSGRPGAGLARSLQLAWAGVRTVRPSVLAWAEASFFALANWLLDAGCLAGAIWALHAGIPWEGFLATYGLTQVAASMPFTPGGLGVVEASLAALLTAYGLPAATALAATVLYRAVSFWALLPIGWGTWTGLEVANHLGARHRPHPWAAHPHAGGVAPPTHLPCPSACQGCDETRKSSLYSPVPVSR